ncbi:MAG: hypothetical protein BRC47_04665 [Cyanobacteria bacterium QS_7_48_42]|nr:MAG: hypothetical protein BRC42_02485 [Cyanobacteria bacterium QS_1_48_34]PSO81994.1 MAG: hypothetical protein BRC41_14320 [Cyanobacteria bacterium QH_9_48_43]PSP00520.1 MAG: hypothetical protein BRC53_00370 [Cyanobacteria bacterium SW_6_48_11]PSP04059.1 MAG: hypothetical protein BRC47_04665 [Cyanobacteria bacterium QS_7_48_42]PSP04220.1 MAG: hypothetical protein BRC51_08135 [Cyanobacteria bacterium SW_12_48_29]PSP07422.1 MAG: hypothetical protein BRC54_04855 [Cyanobacteria bacterium SW_7_4
MKTKANGKRQKAEGDWFIWRFEPPELGFRPINGKKKKFCLTLGLALLMRSGSSSYGERNQVVTQAMKTNQSTQLGKSPKFVAQLLNFFRYQTQLISVKTRMLALLGGSLLVAQASSTMAQPLPSQNESTQPNSSEAAAPRQYEFQAPSPSSSPSPSPSPTSAIYRVEINADSELLLSLVKKVQPKAFVKEAQGIIQAGLFAEKANAQQLVNTLGDKGIRAKVVTVGSEAESTSSN